MIEITNLTKDFDGLLAVDHLTLTFRPGVIGLVGENGAGKSTLFRLLSGVYLPSEGNALIDGHDPRSEEAKSALFFLPDDPYAPKGASVAGLLDFYQGLFDVDGEKFLNLIGKFGLPTNKSIGTFSKGMRRQTFIALALSMKAQYLLMDEAFDGVDPLVVEKIKSEIIACAEEEKTIVISSHNIVALQRLADRFVILTKGKLSKEGENEDLGVEFVKYQAAFPTPVNEENFKSLGLEVVSFKQVGSVCHIVFLHKEGIEETVVNAFHPLFIEKVAIDPDEIVILEMMVAKKGEEE